MRSASRTTSQTGSARPRWSTWCTRCRRLDCCPSRRSESEAMEWTLAHGGHMAAIDARGGGLRCYQVDGVAVVDGYPADARPPAGAGQVLAPWPNRIRDGRYTFAGRSHELTLTEPERSNAIHGLVRGLQWHATEHAESSVTIECTIDDEPGYPFNLRLSTCWSLAEDGLRVGHTAQNLGAGPAPFGLGV